MVEDERKEYKCYIKKKKKGGKSTELKLFPSKFLYLSPH